jgi:hypothetical protein
LLRALRMLRLLRAQRAQRAQRLLRALRKLSFCAKYIRCTKVMRRCFASMRLGGSGLNDGRAGWVLLSSLYCGGS